MPDNNKEQFAVILGAEDQLEVKRVASALASARKIPFQDAAHDAKKCWGIISEHLSETEATSLSSVLRSAGLGVRAIGQSDLVALPESVLLVNGHLREEAFVAVDERNLPHEVSWKKISVVSAASIPSVSLRKVIEKQGPTAGQKALSVGIMMATGLPISIGGKKKTVEKTVSETETDFVMDIVCQDPLARYRIVANHFNYTFLKDRMLPNALANFKLLLAEIKNRSSQASIGRGARILIANQPIATMGYETTADLERESRWLLRLSTPT